MKKILFCILTVLCILTLTTGAETPFLKFEFSHNGAEVLKKGDSVVCKVKYSDINSEGLSSAEFVIHHSNGLEFNNDAVATGLESGWSLWKPNVKDGSVRFAIVDDTTVVPGRNNFEITFSFTVKSDKFSKESLSVSDNYIFTFNGEEINDFPTETPPDFFLVSMPEVTLENAGASLRINNTPALRFGVKYDTLPEGAELGVIVSESDKLDGELTHSSSAAHILDVGNNISDGFYCTDAFEISSNSEKYTFRPYVKLELADGNGYYLYFDALERSAADVALAELDTETDPQLREMLDSFIPKT